VTHIYLPDTVTRQAFSDSVTCMIIYPGHSLLHRTLDVIYVHDLAVPGRLNWTIQFMFGSRE